MKTFESIDYFVNHYKKKITIPTTVDIIINGNVHTFRRTSFHNRQKIDTNQWDRYTFKEDDSIGKLGIQLKANFYRYFDEKALFEVYFELQTPFGNSQNLEKHICPIYFYDKFITEDDYHLDGKQHYSESLKKWTGLKFVNTRIDAYDFIDFRLNAFNNLKSDLFYDSMYDREPHEEAIFKSKWAFNDKGESPYFKEITSPPNVWEESD